MGKLDGPRDKKERGYYKDVRKPGRISGKVQKCSKEGQYGYEKRGSENR